MGKGIRIIMIVLALGGKKHVSMFFLVLAVYMNL